jgi:hypothetical protein
MRAQEGARTTGDAAKAPGSRYTVLCPSGRGDGLQPRSAGFDSRKHLGTLSSGSIPRLWEYTLGETIPPRLAAASVCPRTLAASDVVGGNGVNAGSNPVGGSRLASTLGFPLPLSG